MGPGTPTWSQSSFLSTAANCCRVLLWGWLVSSARLDHCNWPGAVHVFETRFEVESINLCYPTTLNKFRSCLSLHGQLPSIFKEVEKMPSLLIPHTHSKSQQDRSLSHQESWQWKYLKVFQVNLVCLNCLEMNWNLLEAAAQARQGLGQDQSTGPALVRYPLPSAGPGTHGSPHSQMPPTVPTSIASIKTVGSVPGDEEGQTLAMTAVEQVLGYLLELFITSPPLKATAGPFKLLSATSIPLCRVCGSAESPGWHCGTW